MEKKYFDEAFEDPLDVESKELEGVWKEMADQLINEKDSEQTSLVFSKFLSLFEQDPQIALWREAGDPSSWESEEALVRFLRAGLWNEHEALQVLKSYLNCCTDYTSVVRLAIPKELDFVWDRRLNSTTQYRDAYGRRIYIYRPGIWDPDEIDVNALFAASYLLFELMTLEVRTQVAGINIVADLEGFSWKHIRCMGMSEIQCMSSFLSGSFPLWVRRMHVVNAPYIFSVLFNMMKPFLNQRARNCMIFHGSDYSKLHEEVPKFLLPPSMGGPGELDNAVCVDLLKERNSTFQAIVEKALKHAKEGSLP